MRCPARAFVRSIDHSSKLGRAIFQALPFEDFFPKVEKGFGCTVCVADCAIRLNTQHTRTHPGKHRFGKLATLIHLVVCRHQIVTLLLNLSCHFIERSGQHVDFIVIGAHCHTCRQITSTDPFRGPGQTPDGGHNTVCRP